VAASSIRPESSRRDTQPAPIPQDDYIAESRSVQTCSDDLDISGNRADLKRSPTINMQVNIVMKVSQNTSTS